MHIFQDINAFKTYRANCKPNISIGFVPTMGNLHIGHASLIEKSKKENELTFVSIFVNPTQFNQSDDFKHYPRTIEDDCALLENLGVDACLMPDPQSIYPDEYRYHISENKISQLMEGAHRPGHFDGVLSVVMKLFQLVKPSHAYFGEKDYQQYLLIRDMATAFFLDVLVIPCPTIREKSQLAYSSRNNRLTADERLLAEQFATLFHQNLATEQLITQLHHLGIKVDYIEEHAQRRYAAVQIGNIRLIDNYAQYP